MQTFLVTHQLLGIDLENVHPFYAKTAATLESVVNGVGAEFRQCWYDSDSGFLVCEWNAECAEDVKASLESVGLPVESIYPVTRFSADDMLACLPAEVAA